MRRLLLITLSVVGLSSIVNASSLELEVAASDIEVVAPKSATYTIAPFNIPATKQRWELDFLRAESTIVLKIKNPSSKLANMKIKYVLSERSLLGVSWSRGPAQRADGVAWGYRVEKMKPLQENPIQYTGAREYDGDRADAVQKLLEKKIAQSQSETLNSLKRAREQNKSITITLSLGKAALEFPAFDKVALAR